MPSNENTGAAARRCRSLEVFCKNLIPLQASQMVRYAELETFYLDLVTRAQASGIVCGITSGMACVHYGVAQTTKDCDLLCKPESSSAFFDLIDSTEFRGVSAAYRGNLSPPFDARWMAGGWTSHFIWALPDGDGAKLDIFGVPPRASTRWEDDLRGAYVGPHTVAEMKRTNREKDWPFITSLGTLMLDAGEESGWLHLFDISALRRMKRVASPPDELLKWRPVLSVLDGADDEIEFALRAERELWNQLDAVRMAITRAALRPYSSAVRKNGGKEGTLRQQHAVRIQQAALTLVPDPVADHGLDQMIEKACELAAKFLPEASARYLPSDFTHVRSFFV
jgi:hypothetical protein